MSEPHAHTAPDYHGRCEACGERLEAPSHAFRDHAEREGMTLVHLIATVRITPELMKQMGGPSAMQAAFTRMQNL